MKYLTLAILLTLSLLAEMQLAPDYTWVDGTPQITPDGSYVGSGEIQITPAGNYIAVQPDPKPQQNTNQQQNSEENYQQYQRDGNY